ncbi:MAG: DUF4934 domain-containing protein [Mediterranea sp.]|jgi:hypothetical protein|nr:DUF4934 domain-containing protein [Mediterranea sp.]
MDEAKGFALSDMGSEITYVPLETTENSLISKYPHVAIWKDRIVVTSNKQPLLVFDKKSGHFLNQIGHLGDSPGSIQSDGWGGMPFWIDQANGNVYLWSVGYQGLVRYSIDGEYLGTCKLDVALQKKLYLPACALSISGDTVHVHQKEGKENSFYICSFDGQTGCLIDTIPSSVPLVALGDVQEVGYWYNSYLAGGGVGTFTLYYKNGERYRYSSTAPTLWEYKGKQYFKEAFVDTIYTIASSALIPDKILDLGKWTWPIEERFRSEGSDSRIYINYAYENDLGIYFHLHTGYYENTNAKNLPFCAFYNKWTGETMVLSGKTIPDDIDNFLSISIRNVSSEGEWIGLLEASDIVERLHNDEQEMPSSLRRIFESLTDDSNPVVVIVK